MFMITRYDFSTQTYTVKVSTLEGDEKGEHSGLGLGLHDRDISACPNRLFLITGSAPAWEYFGPVADSRPPLAKPLKAMSVVAVVAVSNLKGP
jgi:hypothetical protein